MYMYTKVDKLRNYQNSGVTARFMTIAKNASTNRVISLNKGNQMYLRNMF